MDYFGLSNQTDNYTLEQNEFTSINGKLVLQSLYLYELSEKINIFLTIIFFITGLIGNSIAILIFVQKKFRTNSNHVYFLCLSIVDNLFLVIHLIEDTAKTIQNMESFSNEATYYLINLVTIIDQFEFSCRSINYFRYVLRFVSAYIVVVFTIERLSIVRRPLSIRFKTKKAAWKNTSIIILIGLIINIWVPFLMAVQTSKKKTKYCDINSDFNEEYFTINMIYIFLIMLIPILIILICNTLIIYKTFRSDYKRKILMAAEVNRPLQHQTSVRSASSCDNNRKINSQKNSKKILKTLSIVSFSYAFLNLPYLLSWIYYFYKTVFDNLDIISQNYLFSSLELTEVFYVLNYCIKFYIYFASGSIFLKNSSK
jgi:hypothetical protein